MGRFSRGGSREMPELNTSSLPDLIFTILFFFMIVWLMAKSNPQLLELLHLLAVDVQPRLCSHGSRIVLEDIAHVKVHSRCDVIVVSTEQSPPCLCVVIAETLRARLHCDVLQIAVRLLHLKLVSGAYFVLQRMI